MYYTATNFNGNNTYRPPTIPFSQLSDRANCPSCKLGNGNRTCGGVWSVRLAIALALLALTLSLLAFVSVIDSDDLKLYYNKTSLISNSPIGPCLPADYQGLYYISLIQNVASPYGVPKSLLVLVQGKVCDSIGKGTLVCSSKLSDTLSKQLQEKSACAISANIDYSKCFPDKQVLYDSVSGNYFCSDGLIMFDEHRHIDSASQDDQEYCIKLYGDGSQAHCLLYDQPLGVVSKKTAGLEQKTRLFDGDEILKNHQSNLMGEKSVLPSKNDYDNDPVDRIELHDFSIKKD